AERGSPQAPSSSESSDSGGLTVRSSEGSSAAPAGGRQQEARASSAGTTTSRARSDAAPSVPVDRHRDEAKAAASTGLIVPDSGRADIGAGRPGAIETTRAARLPDALASILTSARRAAVGVPGSATHHARATGGTSEKNHRGSLVRLGEWLLLVLA